MEVNQMVQLQHEFDAKHGWVLESTSCHELLDMLRKDLVGLLGEMGEFSNIVKKITLSEAILGSNDLEIQINQAYPQLSEELIDSLVYIMRIASHLKIDVEAEYVKKLSFNTIKFEKFEQL